MIYSCPRNFAAANLLSFGCSFSPRCLKEKVNSVTCKPVESIWKGVRRCRCCHNGFSIEIIIAMAGIKPGVHIVQLKPISVPDHLLKGNKFIKWDDDAAQGVPVTLKVDPKGHILYWKDMQKSAKEGHKPEMDFLEISLIRDTRTGKYARVPKEGKLRDSCMMGAPDIALEDKTISICYGTDMINISWLNFVCNSIELATEWADELLLYSQNLLALNGSVTSFLEKTFTRFSLVTHHEGKIAMKNVVKHFASSKDDRRKVEKALEAANLPSGKNDTLNPNKFMFDDFFNFYRHLTQRAEIDEVFRVIGAKNKPYLTVKQFQDFLNKTQRDPRLNEILYPYVSQEKAQEIINIFEKNSVAGKGLLSQQGFLLYLLSDDNLPIPADKYDLNEDMSQPMSHYFINSSHNTYLTGHQITGRSSVEVYRQVLLSGCRCIELDCWDGKGDEEPMITHGFTMCTEIPFKEVIEAIAESAFKRSDYPVILSFENHCSPKQQAKMAQYCKDIFGDKLLTEPLQTHLLEKGVPLPSPEMLKRKILIKNKKVHNLASQKNHRKSELEKSSSATPTQVKKTDASEERILSESLSTPVEKSDSMIEEEDDLVDSESDSEDEVGELTEEQVKLRQKMKKEKGTAGSEAAAASVMSELVNYVTPVHFHSFEIAEKRDRSYEMSSFVETQAMSKLKEQPVEFVNYNKRQMSRIYPKGTRVDSSNFMPQVFWNAGCQLVALNFQTLDLAMQLNLGTFEYNGCSGFILKPEFMRRNDRHFDPFAESTVDGIVAGSVSVKIISGQFLTDKKVGTFVEVEMYGLPADTVRKKFRTKVIPANGLNPIYNEEPFVFKKVVLPNLAQLRVVASDDTGRFIGHRILPIDRLRPGYRHISLRNVCNQPLTLPTLFVYIDVKDYVPDAFADFADALANPIAHLLEKHAQQLAVLTEDFDVEEETEPNTVILQPNMAENTKITFQQRSQSLFFKIDRSDKEPIVEKAPNGLTGRAISVGHMALGQQDSNMSSFSQASGGSGVSSFPGQENGQTTTLPSQVAIDRVTKLELAKPTPLDELKDHKILKRLKTKLFKETEHIWKKHGKLKTSSTEKHEFEKERCEYLHERDIEKYKKSQRKAIQKASKRGNEESAQQSMNEHIQRMIQEYQKKISDMDNAHSQSMAALHKEFFKKEFDCNMRLHEPYYIALYHVVLKHQETQLKRFQKIQKKERAILKKSLDAHNRSETKALAKKHRNKEELQRRKREAEKKHITMAVAELEKLQKKLKQMEEQLVEANKEILDSVDIERNEVQEKIQADYESRCEEVDKRWSRNVDDQAPSSGHVSKTNSAEEMTEL